MVLFESLRRRSADLKIPRTVGFFFALVLSGCIHHRQADLARTHSALMGSLPDSVKSLPIRIVPSYEHPVLAWTTVGMMDRYVSYNPSTAQKLPADVLAFALVHEYAHLRFNHVDALGLGAKTAAEIRQRELEADRFAARFWARHDPRVAQAAAAAFLSPAGHRALGPEESERDSGYPTRTERARAILACLAETREDAPLENPR